MPYFLPKKASAGGGQANRVPASPITRFKKLHIYLRGFGQPMWEVGERFVRLHGAIADGQGRQVASQQAWSTALSCRTDKIIDADHKGANGSSTSSAAVTGRV